MVTIINHDFSNQGISQLLWSILEPSNWIRLKKGCGELTHGNRYFKYCKTNKHGSIVLPYNIWCIYDVYMIYIYMYRSYMYCIQVKYGTLWYKSIFSPLHQPSESKLKKSRLALRAMCRGKAYRKDWRPGKPLASIPAFPIRILGRVEEELGTARGPGQIFCWVVLW